MKYEINIHDDFCDDLVRLVLFSQLEGVIDEIKTLKRERKMLRKKGDDLPNYRYQDLLDTKQIRKSLMAVVKYYSTPDQWEETLEKLK